MSNTLAVTDWLEEAIKRQGTPKHLREGTVDEFCAKHGIESKQYYYHLSKPENEKKIIGYTLNKAKESAPEILDVLVEMAKDKDIRAIDIYMDSILQLAKNLDIKTDGRPIIQIAEAIANKNGIATQSTESNS